MKRFIISVFLSITTFLLSTNFVFAESIAYFNHSPYISGWDMDSSNMHAGTNYFTYRIDSSAQMYDSVFNDGKAMWSSIFTLTKSSSSGNVVSAYYNSTTNTVATTNPTGTSDGHVTSFTMSINSYRFDQNGYETQKRTIAHECGHIFVLTDVYDSSLSSNIMYGYSSSSKYVTNPDIMGVKFSSHIHKQSDHTNFYYSSLNSYQHAKVCGICYGYYIENHTFVNGRCSKCGY
jgi:hypothetical protein